MRSLLLPLLLSAALFGCSPKYNWRDYQSPDAAFVAQFPAKPATATQTVNLNGPQVALTMTAAEVGDTVFAVGWADVAEIGQVPAALTAMQTALVQNIGGSITSRRPIGAGADIEARGQLQGKAMRLQGHFRTQGRRVVQIIVMGPAAEFDAEQTEAFFTAVKLPPAAP